MMKPSRMLVNYIADTAIVNAAENPRFRKPFIRLGPLFMSVGAWVFQNGGCLGYALRDNPALLGKLLGVDADNAAAYIEGSKATAQSRSDWVNAGERSLFNAYVLLEFGKLEIVTENGLDQKALEQKCDEDFAQTVTVLSFHGGAFYGFYYPEEFADCWSGTYGARSPNEWAEAKELGIVDGEQSEQTLQLGVSTVATGVYEWAQSYAGGYVTDAELTMIRDLAESSGHFDVSG